MMLKIHHANPQERLIQQVVCCLNEGGIIIYPTDSVYGFGCSIYQPKAVEKIARIKGLNPEKAQFSFIFHSMSQVAEYVLPLDNHIFRLMKKHLPGPFTFILNANNQIPKILRNRRKTIGVRIPDNLIALEIVRQLNHPLMTTSVHDDDQMIEYTTDPELIYEKYNKFADIIIDGGIGNLVASTIVDCTQSQINIIRQGIGVLEI